MGAISQMQVQCTHLYFFLFHTHKKLA